MALLGIPGQPGPGRCPQVVSAEPAHTEGYPLRAQTHSDAHSHHVCCTCVWGTTPGQAAPLRLGTHPPRMLWSSICQSEGCGHQAQRLRVIQRSGKERRGGRVRDGGMEIWETEGGHARSDTNIVPHPAGGGSDLLQTDAAGGGVGAMRCNIRPSGWVAAGPC